ncbi:MAG TPA: HAMP domain-containing sensor histidine kinase [Pyrinomonadaceae bacterium]|nr:HAMP domain-containing sensor histidine kinase [Pyrinomonadaceae bacterium]
MRRRKTAIFFLVFGICLIAIAVALQVGWILLNLREVALLVLGAVFFALIITGMVLNTIFLVREIRRSEQHDAFLNSVTHELKTPIASIKLYLETLKARDVAPEKREEFYDVMLADSDRLLHTVEQVLQAGRTGEKRRQMNVSEVNVGDLLTDAVSIVRTRYHLEDDVVRLSEPASDIKVLGDEDDLRTVFVNLLDNAVKYSGDERRVTIRAKRTALNNKVDVFIRDNGIGIPPAELKRIFKRFYRVPDEAAKSAKGTGLGLAIVRSIVAKHGGQIKADSKGPTRGSTFIVQLPLV